MSEQTRHLIPPPSLVRAELARNVREGRRLRSLLRLARMAEDDRRFYEKLITEEKRNKVFPNQVDQGPDRW